jgi:hypothetical protein
MGVGRIASRASWALYFHFHLRGLGGMGRRFAWANARIFENRTVHIHDFLENYGFRECGFDVGSGAIGEFKAYGGVAQGHPLADQAEAAAGDRDCSGTNAEKIAAAAINGILSSPG